jgi:hypothetical protein
MKARLMIIAAAGVLLGALALAPPADAGHLDWSFGVGFHVGGLHFRVGFSPQGYGGYPGPFFLTTNRLHYPGYSCNGACFRRGAGYYHRTVDTGRATAATTRIGHTGTTTGTAIETATARSVAGTIRVIVTIAIATTVIVATRATGTTVGRASTVGEATTTIATGVEIAGGVTGTTAVVAAAAANAIAQSPGGAPTGLGRRANSSRPVPTQAPAVARSDWRAAAVSRWALCRAAP